MPMAWMGSIRFGPGIIPLKFKHLPEERENRKLLKLSAGQTGDGWK